MPANTDSERALDSIIVGVRHRKDLGDIDELAESINELGMLHPITITPDGVLVCGRRRLEAVRRLGWRTIKVWVRSGISDALTQLLAQQDENALHKPLSPIEQTELYTELKRLYAEDAQHRQVATQFGADGPDSVPGQKASGEVNGAGRRPAPQGTRGGGDSRTQAARAITGEQSYHRFDRIAFLQAVSSDPFHPTTVRELAAHELDAVETGAPIEPAYRRVKAAIELASQPDTDTDDLDSLAAEALARVRQKQARRGIRAIQNSPSDPRPDSDAQPDEPIKYRTLRSFLLTWTELEGWTKYYDVNQVAQEISNEEYGRFDRVITESLAFRDRLAHARTGSLGTSTV